MEQLIRYLGSGKIYKYPKELAVSLTIFKITDITNIIIPFFEKNPLPSAWCKTIRLSRFL